MPASLTAMGTFGGHDESLKWQLRACRHLEGVSLAISTPGTPHRQSVISAKHSRVLAAAREIYAWQIWCQGWRLAWGEGYTVKPSLDFLP